MNGVSEPSQTVQRVKVGVIGLAAVVLLIALASAIIGSATRERPVAGTAQANLVASMAAGNDAALIPVEGEPLAQMGAAPGANVQDGADVSR